MRTTRDTRRGPRGTLGPLWGQTYGTGVGVGGPWGHLGTFGDSRAGAVTVVGGVVEDDGRGAEGHDVSPRRRVGQEPGWGRGHVTAGPPRGWGGGHGDRGALGTPSGVGGHGGRGWHRVAWGDVGDIGWRRVTQGDKG